MPSVGLAGVFDTFGVAYLANHALPRGAAKVWRAIVACRTPALGGYVESCAHCGRTHVVYHSCRNRHCPTCQTRAKEAWLAARQRELLPVPYFHLVFTLPHTLNPLIAAVPRRIYELLFATVSATLNEFAQSPRHLGGQPAFTLVLHTWKQDLGRHVHVHALVAGGALAAVFGVLTLLTLGQPVSLVLCELAMGGVVLVMTCILPMDERFIASPMAIARMLRDPEQLAEWLYFARMKANGGVEVTDVSIENIPQPATVKTCQDAICVFQRAQIALMVQCDAQKAYGLMKQVLESEARLSYTAWKLLLSDGVVAELLAGEPGEFTALYRGKAGTAIRQVMFRMVDYALPAYAVAMLVTHEAREAEVVRNTLAPVREKMPELDALMKAIEEKAARIES